MLFWKYNFIISAEIHARYYIYSIQTSGTELKIY
jgi:hypothetical protein